MGGAVSSGQDNDELIDNLRDAGYIKTLQVERVFRIVDRAHYYLAECTDSAYKDLAWKSGTLHLSAPCIYSEVMEALELRNGLSFLNLGSGTGYLNTMVGFMIGPYGINHGIELHAENVTYANKKLECFIQEGHKFDDLELCEPQFVVGNCLNLAPENHLYDRVYCGASCPPEQRETIQNMIKVNGILVIPVGDQLLKIKRINETEFTTENVLPVSFASLVLPVRSENTRDLILLPDVNPMSLQCICRVAIRDAIRVTFDFNLPTAGQRSNLNRVKHVKASRFLRSEVGRPPLNILPTAQGLMLLAAFDSSDEDDDEDDDDDDDDENEKSRESIVDRMLDLNQQFHHVSDHASEPSVESAADDVDSELSDMEDEGIHISYLNDVNGNKNSLLSSSSSQQNSQDRDTESVEEKVVGRISSNSVKKNGNMTRSSLKHLSKEESSLAKDASDSRDSNTYKRFSDSILTIVSPQKRNASSFQLEEDIAPGVHETNMYQPISNDVLTSEFNSRSPAIQVTPSTGVSMPRAIKESYSISADTSETSGFGSLGDDNFQTTSSQQSGRGSLKDDMDVMPGEDSVPSCSPASNNKRSPQSKSSIGESSVDYDSLMADTADTAWIDTEDDDDDDESHLGECKLKKIKSLMEYKITKKDGNSNDVAGDNMKVPRKSPDFSAYLKMKVESLPLPSSLKAFILYYRQIDNADIFDC
uniref:SOCS box domain-containing protein n=1 Tax=Arion vulgaris TaxID=1028688 RepID=A0A0B7BAD7_9EUPU